LWRRAVEGGQGRGEVWRKSSGKILQRQIFIWRLRPYLKFEPVSLMLPSNSGPSIASPRPIAVHTHGPLLKYKWTMEKQIRRPFLKAMPIRGWRAFSRRAVANWAEERKPGGNETHFRRSSVLPERRFGPLAEQDGHRHRTSVAGEGKLLGGRTCRRLVRRRPGQNDPPATIQLGGRWSRPSGGADDVPDQARQRTSFPRLAIDSVRGKMRRAFGFCAPWTSGFRSLRETARACVGCGACESPFPSGRQPRRRDEHVSSAFPLRFRR